MEVDQSLVFLCPNCSDVLELENLPSTYSSLPCPHCKTVLTIRIALIRAKRARKEKDLYGLPNRRYVIRVSEITGPESIIEFVSNVGNDIELRARDLAAFIYQGGDLKLVHNFNIKYTFIVNL
jgi:predicted RNA-binding Zn-ribbon protein involved in translation (DUF1610 family)